MNVNNQICRVLNPHRTLGKRLASRVAFRSCLVRVPGRPELVWKKSTPLYFDMGNHRISDKRVTAS
jgi:hypothetical protein